MKNLKKNLESLNLSKFQIENPEQVNGGRAPEKGDPISSDTYGVVIVGSTIGLNGSYETYD